MYYSELSRVSVITHVKCPASWRGSHSLEESCYDKTVLYDDSNSELESYLPKYTLDLHTLSWSVCAPCLSPTSLKLTCWNLIPKVMVTGGGAFGWEVIRSGRWILTNGISVFMQRGQRAGLPLFHDLSSKWEASSLQPGRGPSTEPHHAGPVTSDLHNYEINFCCL